MSKELHRRIYVEAPQIGYGYVDFDSSWQVIKSERITEYQYFLARTSMYSTLSKDTWHECNKGDYTISKLSNMDEHYQQFTLRCLKIRDGYPNLYTWEQIILTIQNNKTFYE